jgi:hypothetical protein
VRPTAEASGGKRLCFHLRTASSGGAASKIDEDHFPLSCMRIALTPCLRLRYRDAPSYGLRYESSARS